MALRCASVPCRGWSSSCDPNRPDTQGKAGQSPRGGRPGHGRDAMSQDAQLTIARVLLAFLVAPVLVPVFFLIVAWVAGGSVPPAGLPIVVGIVAYALTLILGVPSFLFFQAWQLHSWQAYFAAGLILGLVPELLLYGLSTPESAFMVPSAVIATILEALLFWWLVYGSGAYTAVVKGVRSH